MLILVLLYTKNPNITKQNIIRCLVSLKTGSAKKKNAITYVLYVVALVAKPRNLF